MSIKEINTWPGGEWQTTRLLGKGGFGKVYEIQRMEFGKVYTAAMKVMNIPKDESEIDTLLDSGMTQEEASTYFKKEIENLMNEFEILAKLKGYTNIVSYEDHKILPQENGIGWTILIRMELLTGVKQYFKTHPVNEKSVIKLGCDICTALQLCHERNIIHRDIKLDNIFVNASGDFELGDFGIARITENTLSTMTTIGTPNYMAPEMFKKERYGMTADIYALGIVLYMLLNQNRGPFFPVGRPLEPGDQEKALNARMENKPIPLPVNGSQRLKAIVMKAIAYRPEDRFQSAAEMKAALLGQGEDPRETAYRNAVRLAGKAQNRQDFEKASGAFEILGEYKNSRAYLGKCREACERLAKAEKTEPAAYEDIEKTERYIPPVPGPQPVKIEIGNPAENIAKADPGSRESGKKKKEKGGPGRMLLGAAAAVLILGIALLFFLVSGKSYELHVNGGSGSGMQKAGQMVTVIAEVPEGVSFVRWDVEGELPLSEEELCESELRFKMPKGEITLTAVFEAKVYSVTVRSGSGSGDYAPGDEVEITADNVDGQVFDHWEVGKGDITFREADQMQTTFIMGEEDVEITAVYGAQTYHLTVEKGSGSGDYTAGEKVTLTADQAKKGKAFKNWQVVEGNISLSDPEKETITITMPEENLILRAVYLKETYLLTVRNGNGSGEYETGEEVTIRADETDASGQRFEKWSVTVGKLQLEDPAQTILRFKMPAENTEIMAVYAEALPETEPVKKYAVYVFGGDGSGEYAEGETVTIKAAQEPGKKFNCWYISVVGGQTVENDNAEFTFSMPAADLNISALYDIVE